MAAASSAPGDSASVPISAVAARKAALRREREAQAQAQAEAEAQAAAAQAAAKRTHDGRKGRRRTKAVTTAVGGGAEEGGGEVEEYIALPEEDVDESPSGPSSDDAEDEDEEGGKDIEVDVEPEVEVAPLRRTQQDRSPRKAVVGANGSARGHGGGARRARVGGGGGGSSSRRRAGDAIPDQRQPPHPPPIELDPLTPILRPIWKGDDTNVAFAPPSTSTSAQPRLWVALPLGQTMAFRGVVRVRVLHGAVVVQGAVLKAGSRREAAMLLAPARHACPAPVAVDTVPSSSSSQPSQEFIDVLPGASAEECAILELSAAPASLRSIESVGRVCPLPGEDVPFGFKDGTDALFEAGLPSLPGFRLIGGSSTGTDAYLNEAGARAGRADVVELPRNWVDALQEAVPNFLGAGGQATESCLPLKRALVRGPRGVGKSLFARTLLNAALTCVPSTSSPSIPAIAFLDLDLGQTEFGPPGMLTLNLFSTSSTAPLMIGPAWTTLRTPVRAHFVGDISAKNMPGSYRDAALELVGFYRDHVAQGYTPAPQTGSEALADQASAVGQQDDPFESRSRKRRRLGATTMSQNTSAGSTKEDKASFIPLIVNTQGWVSGLGADLLDAITAALDPSHIFDFAPEVSNLASSAVDPGTAAISTAQGSSKSSTQTRTHHIRVQPSTAAVGPAAQPRLRLTAADQRTLSLLSYLHATSLPSYGVGSKDVSDDDEKEEEGCWPAWDFSQTLGGMRPFILDAPRVLARGGICVLPLGGAVVDALKLHALNGAVVGLVEVADGEQRDGDDAGAEEREDEDSRGHSDGISRHRASWLRLFRRRSQGPPAFASSRCLGLAVVRSIDRDKGELHLVGPLGAILASRASHRQAPHGLGSGLGLGLGLVKGALDLPLLASLDVDTIEALKRPHLLLQGQPHAAPAAVGVDEEEDDSSEDDDEDATNSSKRTRRRPPTGRSRTKLFSTPPGRVPYLDWPAEDDAGADVEGSRKRRVRKNVQRRGFGAPPPPGGGGGGGG